jgi:hypothetical protein
MTAAVGSYGSRKVRRRLAYHWLKNKAHRKASHRKVAEMVVAAAISVQRAGNRSPVLEISE